MKDRRHMYIKTCLMQNLPIYYYQYISLDNVMDLMVMVPPTTALSEHRRFRGGELDSFFCTYAFLKGKIIFLKKTIQLLLWSLA
jgi:hypothetical protein